MKKNIYFIIVLASSLSISSYANAHSHNHDGHNQSEKALQASQGIFDDQDVQDRSLTDWQGTWQSVYNYLQNGDLDEVIKAKVEKNPTKTFAQYQAYYQQGYTTDIQFIGIEGNRVDFHKQKVHSSCQYDYAGYKILTYVSGKKGVRYLFTCQDKDSDAPKYIQFSDHIIEPTKSVHFHLYMGNQSHEELLTEMDNWPTYYPLSMSKDDIVHEMLYH